MPFSSELVHHLRALTRAIYVVTDEEDTFIQNFRKQMPKYTERTFVFNHAFGMMKIDDLVNDWQNRTHTREGSDIPAALKRIYTDDPREFEHFYILTDPDVILDDEFSVRQVMNIIHQLHNDPQIVKCLIFVGSSRFIPAKLSRYIEVVELHGLDQEELLKTVTDSCSNFKMDPPADYVSLFRGFTSYEIDQVITQAMVSVMADPRASKRIDPHFVSEYRRKQIRKTDLVQIIDTQKFTFKSVGGVERFKEWASATKSCWTPEGRKFGLRVPRGVLLMGVYGCGKSLSAKALATEWELPLVQLELGQLRNPAVGRSENNLIQALRIIETVAPCVTGETEITLADGSIRTIQDLWQDTPDDLQVKCWNEKMFRVASTKVMAITRRISEAFRVEAANGYYLNPTANHEHYVLRGGMPEWVRTDELNVGDMLAVPTTTWDGTEDCIAYHPNGIRVLQFDNSVENSEIRRGGGGYRDAIVPRLPIKWSSELGWLLGIIEGDGYIGARGRIGLVNTSTILLSTFEGRISTLFGIECSRRSTNSDELPNLSGLSESSEFKPCWDTSVSNLLASEFLKAAREGILTAPLNVRAAFLAGWIDADGCIQNSKVTLTVKGPKLWLERRSLARNLIQSLGVVPSKFDTCNLEITGTRAEALAIILSKYLVAKSSKAKLVEASKFGFDRGMGFACGNLLKEARLASNLTFADLGVSSSITWGCENGSKKLSERHLVDYISVLGSSASQLKQLYEAECRWVEVTEIAPIGEQEVFDLVCEGDDTHSFFANGLITHNCAVWIDEAEKSLAGGASSAQSDAGTTSRMLGILSTWAQELESPVSLILTANSLRNLPPEMVNRLPDRFFFDVPDESSVIDILKIHTGEFNQDVSGFQLGELAKAAASLVGREIEQCVESAMTASFNAKKPALDEEILHHELKTKSRIITTMKDEIAELTEWVGYDPDTDDGVKAKLAAPKRRGKSFKIVGSASRV